MLSCDVSGDDPIFRWFERTAYNPGAVKPGMGAGIYTPISQFYERNMECLNTGKMMSEDDSRISRLTSPVQLCSRSLTGHSGIMWDLRSL